MSGQTIPANWSDLQSDGRGYVFPTVGLDGVMSMLLQYIGAGGTLSDEGLDIDEAALKRLYDFYATGIADGMIPPEVASLASMDAVWAAMSADSGDIVDTTAGFLLNQSESPDGLLYGGSPTEDGQAVSVSRTWALVILAADPGQRAQVLELTQFLLEPGIHGQWSQFANLLPTAPAATATWNVNQPYYGFIIALLEGNTFAIPNGRPFTELFRQMQTAQQEVLNGRMTPEEAVTLIRPTP